MERRTLIVAALLAILIAVPFVSMDISARPSPDEGCTILGVSAESTTGFQTYTLDLTYESRTVGTQTTYLLKMESTYTPPESPGIGSGESSGEFGKDVVIKICQGGHTSGDHRAPVAGSKDIRIKYETDLGIEGFYMPGGTESKLPEGEYIVQIRTSSNDMLIVENALYVADIQKITFTQPSEGSVDARDVYVPKGSVATADDDVLTITYSPTGGVYTKNTVAVVKAVPPSGLEVDGWYVGDSKITTTTLTADTEIEVRWTSSLIDYKLTYDPNGGTGGPGTESHQSSASEYEFTVPSTAPTRSGYIFKGWSDTGSAPAQYFAGSKIVLQSSSPTKTVKAVWKGTPVVPDPKDVTISVDEIYIPQGISWKLSFTVDPPVAATAVVWGSSDKTVATVSRGTVTALKEGTATITAYDREGKALDSVTIVVVSPSERTVEEETETEAGGSVIATYEIGPEGERVLVNPIVINPGDLKRVTEDQVLISEGYIDTMTLSGIVPQVIIPTTEQTVTVPYELIDAIVTNDGSLTVTEGDVTLVFGSKVLSDLGYFEDLELVVIPVEVEDDPSLPDIRGDAKVYEVYILLDGTRVTRTLADQVEVTVDYQLEDGRTVDRLHVYYIDVEPFEEYQFVYNEDGVHFGVRHFSHYALVYDTSDGSGQCCIWCWILILAAVILIVFLIWFFLWKRFKLTLTNEGGRIVSVPEGWKRESDSSISIRMRRKQEIAIPEIEAESPEDPYGMRIIVWDPSPPEKITHSMELRAISSDGPVEMIGPQSDQE